MSLVANVIIIKVISICVLNASSKCVYDKPAKPNNLEIIDLDVNRTITSNTSYPCGNTIYYKCQSNFSLIIGNNVSHCVGGEWSGSVPSCDNCKALPKTSLGYIVDVEYERTVVGHNGQHYVPNGTAANFTCGRINRFLSNNNQSIYELRGTSSVRCLEGQWIGLNGTERPHCAVRRLVEVSIGEQDSTSLPKYLVYVMSGALCVSAILVLSLCAHTVRQQKKKRRKKQLSAKKCDEKLANIYDIYDHNIYDDTVVANDYENLKGVDNQYENIDVIEENHYEVIDEQMDQDYLEIFEQVYEEVNQEQAV